MQTADLLDIKEFFSVCTQLVLEAGNQIRQSFETQSHIAKKKLHDEEYTDVDLRIQAIYVDTFKHFWSKIKIVAEEDPNELPPTDYDFQSLKTNLIPSTCFSGLSNQKIDLEQAILWIDPLDGTSEFIKGKRSGVTTLIGISVDGKAKLGVIAQFYEKIQGENGVVSYEWKPKCYFADADYPELYELDYLDEKKIRKIDGTRKRETEDLICALMYFDDMEKDQVRKSENVNVFEVEGVEALSVALGKSDFYVYRGSEYYKKWDLCAGDAIISCLGGVIIDPFGKRFTYEEDPASLDVPFGQLIISSRKLVEKVLEILNYKGEEEAN